MQLGKNRAITMIAIAIIKLLLYYVKSLRVFFVTLFSSSDTSSNTESGEEEKLSGSTFSSGTHGSLGMA